ncbi:MAG: FhaA domain-containing protein [Acidimicrobiia bacterium]
MKLARQLERRLEDALDHLAGRIFRGGLHVSELAARVAREAELAEFRTPAGPATANHFTLLVNPANLAADPEPLARELELAFAELAADRGWRLEGPVQVTLDRSGDVGVGTINSAASVAVGTLPCWAQLTSPEGEKTPIRHNRATVGRSAEADVVLDHPEISRTHALIYRQGGEIYLVDTGSANGTRIDGAAVGRTPTRMAAVAELTLANHLFRFTPCRS